MFLQMIAAGQHAFITIAIWFVEMIEDVKGPNSSDSNV